MEERNRKKHDAVFKRQAVELADKSGKTDREIENELGVFQGAIGQWRRALQDDPAHAFPGIGRLKPIEEENRQLRRELEIAREERDILKKAVAIFSKGPKKGSNS
jgi:transposase